MATITLNEASSAALPKTGCLDSPELGERVAAGRAGRGGGREGGGGGKCVGLSRLYSSFLRMTKGSGSGGSGDALWTASSELESQNVHRNIAHNLLRNKGVDPPPPGIS
eukprot:scaffold24093_cov105-Isochrysis_galbana.AAC.6